MVILLCVIKINCNVFRHFLHQIAITQHIGIIKRRINLIEHTEWCRDSCGTLRKSTQSLSMLFHRPIAGESCCFSCQVDAPSQVHQPLASCRQLILNKPYRHQKFSGKAVGNSSLDFIEHVSKNVFAFPDQFS